MKDLELRHLRVFVAVVEAGSHTRAARELGLSQSTVSETLASLERAAGVALFHKSPALTAAGEAVLDHARRILAMTGELGAALAKASRDATATLVVGAVESVSAYVLPSRLAELRARRPNVRLEVVTGSCSEIRERVATGKCDVGLLLEAQSVGATDDVVAHARFAIITAPAHPLASLLATPDELRRCDFYMCDATGNYHDVLRRYFEAAELPVPRTQSLGSVEGVKRGVSIGHACVGMLPAHAVEQELADGSLVELSVSPALPGLVLRAVVGASRSPMVDELLDALRGTRLDG
ncbi:MAG TPA: LysR family transcriptional regulator [Kofleriaceae bacterium]|jgi:DNA-binding transcriptional LysR family regulator|nr:LysR family transcriptional regulator [Kofleriaceae bacterium]